MAVVEMSKLKLVGLKQDSDKILNFFTKCRQFEISSAQDAPETEADHAQQSCSHPEKEQLRVRQAKVGFAIDYLIAQNNALEKMLSQNQKDVKKNRADKIVIDYTPYKNKGGRKSIGMDDFYDCGAKEYELMSAADAIEKINFERLDIKAKIAKLEAEINTMLPYKYFPLPFSKIGDTKHTALILGYIKSIKAKQTGFLDAFDQYCEFYPGENGDTALAVVVRLADKERMKATLNEQGYTLCAFDDDSKAKHIIARNENEIEQLKKYDFSKLSQLLGYEKYLFDFKILYDYFNIQLEKADADEGFHKTAYTFMMEGYMPKESSKEIMDQLSQEVSVFAANLYEIGENDNPPTLLKNKAIIQPFEEVTNMYSPPNYRESDPNFVMSIFFFLIFGIMMADAGYGAILTIAAFLYLKIAKPEKTRMIKLFGICGISAMIWGVLFGSYFSIEGIYAPVMAPMDEPIKLMALSIVVGLVHLMAGYIYKMVSCFREKKILDGLFDGGWLLLFLIGVSLIAAEILINAFATNILDLSGGGYFAPALSQTLMQTGMIVLVASIGGIVLTGGRSSKSIGGKIGGGLFGVYGLINLFSDILSYIRIFGLALASAAIGSAFNKLIEIVMELIPVPAIGYIAGGILYIVLHVLNLGLGLLSAYVHDMRLQVLEFYGKFYTGEGRLFRPLGCQTKYVYFA